MIKLRFFAVLMAILGLGLLMPAVGGATTIFVSPVADSYVWSTNPNTPYGGATSMYVRATSTDTRHAFLKFNLTGLIPAGEQIVEAELYLNLLSSNQAGNVEVRHVADNTWTEGGITWNNAPEAGSVMDAEFVSTTPGWVEWDLLEGGTGWINDQVLSVMLQIPNEPGAGFPRFYSRNYGTPAVRPYLEIVTAVVPVPPSALLLGSGLLGLVIIRRKRKSSI